MLKARNATSGATPLGRHHLLSCQALAALAALALAALMVTGCAETQRPEASGEANVRGLHAIVDAPEAVFRIEERSLGAIDYKGATSVEISPVLMPTMP